MSRILADIAPVMTLQPEVSFPLFTFRPGFPHSIPHVWPIPSFGLRMTLSDSLLA